MPTESPTRRASTPARSSSRAMFASYAVSMAIFSPRRFFSISSRVRTGIGIPILRVCGSQSAASGRQRFRQPRVDGASDFLGDIEITERRVFADLTGHCRHEQVVGPTNRDYFDRLRLAFLPREIDQSLDVRDRHLPIQFRVNEQNRLPDVVDDLGRIERENALSPRRIDLLAD